MAFHNDGLYCSVSAFTHLSAGRRCNSQKNIIRIDRLRKVSAYSKLSHAKADDASKVADREYYTGSVVETGPMKRHVELVLVMSSIIS